MRRRVRWSFYVVLALSCLWCGVVWIYSLGERRERLRLVRRVDDLDRRLVIQARSLLSASNDLARAILLRPASLSGFVSADDQPRDPPFRPRLLGFGQSKSVRRRNIYADFETSPGVVSRRYFWLPSSD